MAFVVIVYNEFLQFECWTPDPRAQPEELQCEGLNGFFTALRVTDVQILQGSSFLFDPQLIFPLSDQSPQFADPGLFPNPETFATLLLDPSKGLTFQGSDMAPMLLVRDIFVQGNFPRPEVVSRRHSAIRPLPAIPLYSNLQVLSRCQGRKSLRSLTLEFEPCHTHIRPENRPRTTLCCSALPCRRKWQGQPHARFSFEPVPRA
jgi:hypothetical protein